MNQLSSCSWLTIVSIRSQSRLGFTRPAENSKRAHFRVSELQKHHQNSTRRPPPPREGRKNTNCVGRREGQVAALWQRQDCLAQALQWMALCAVCGRWSLEGLDFMAMGPRPIIGLAWSSFHAGGRVPTRCPVLLSSRNSWCWRRTAPSGWAPLGVSVSQHVRLLMDDWLRVSSLLTKKMSLSKNLLIASHVSTSLCLSITTFLCLRLPDWSNDRLSNGIPKNCASHGRLF